MGYCTICGKPATGVYCDDCRKMLEKRVNKGLVVTKPAITSHADRRQASSSSGSSRATNHQPARKKPAGEERASGGGIAVSKNGLPLYCPACSNLLRKERGLYTCKACGYLGNGENP